MARKPRTRKPKTGRLIDEEAIGVANEAAIRAELVTEAVDEFVLKRMTEYGVYTLENRAIPSVEDGLMPVQRRVVWSMKQLGLNNGSAFLKHATIIGEAMGRYHPHGDASIYGAGVRLATGTPAPLIQGAGNWGSYTAKPAAMRYHEARPSKLTDTMLLDPYYLRAVDYVPNFDGAKQEPVVLPAKLPMVLAIEQQGIAVGITTFVPAFTLDSLTRVTKAMLKGQQLSPKALMKHLKFASVWGGHVTSSPKELLEFFRTGYGPVEWCCDYEVRDNTVTVTGIPPNFNFDNRLVSIAKLDGVASALNQADRNFPVKMVITLKRGNDADKARTLDKIKKILTNRITYRINVVRRSYDGSTVPPSVRSELVEMSVLDVLEDWLDWRLDYLERRALLEEERLLKQQRERQLLLRTAIDNLEVIFKILRTKGINKVAALSKQLKISEDSSREIWQIAVGRLDRLSSDDINNELARIQTLRKQIRVDLNNLGASALRRSNFSAN